MRFMPDRFKPSPRVFFSCLLLSQIFALVYPLGNLTVESQDRKCSIQYFKYPSSDLRLSPINRNEKTRVSKRHMPNRTLAESPSLFSCFPHIRVSALDTHFLILVSRVTRSILHNIHYLNFETRLKTIRHMNEKVKVQE